MPFDPLTPVVTLPTEFDTSRPTFTGTKRTATDAASLASALAACVDGDQVVIPAGTTITISGTKITCPNRGTSGWVEIRTDITDAALNAVCPPGTRMTPAKAASLNLATIKVNMPNDNGITFADGASGYRFTGLTIKVDPSLPAANYSGGAGPDGIAELIRTGNFNKVNDSQETSRIMFDRMYLYGSQTIDCKRAIFFCSSYSGIVDSWVEDFYKENNGGGDSQGLLFAGNRGPYQVINNYIDGCSENVMMGGAWTATWTNGTGTISINSIPSDLVFRYNLFSFKTAQYSLKHERKNAFEIKSAYRVLAEYNIFENVPRQAQDGAIWGLHANSDGTSTAAGSSDITMRYNWCRAGGGIKVFATADDTANEHFMDRVYIHDNLFELADDTSDFSLAPNPVNYDGFCAQFSRPLNWWVLHNTWAKWQMTADHVGVSIFGEAGEANTLSMQSNIFHANVYGLKGETAPGGYGLAALTSITDPSVGGTAAVDYNLWVGLDGAFQGRAYPAHDWNVTADSGVGFSDLAGGGTGYALTPGSTYSATGTKPGHDGLDRGANITTLMTGTAIATSGDRTGAGTPTATQLLLSVQPAGAVSGVALTQQPSGTVADDVGDTVTSDSSTVTASWVSISGDASPSGTLTTAAVAGAWAFSDLALTWTVPSQGHWHFADGSLTGVDGPMQFLPTALLPSLAPAQL